MDHLFTSVCVDHRSLNLLKTLGNRVENLLCFVKHLFFRNLNLLLLLIMARVHRFIWNFISLFLLVLIFIIFVRFWVLLGHLALILNDIWFYLIRDFIILDIFIVIRFVFRVSLFLNWLFLRCDTFNFDRFGWWLNFFLLHLHWLSFLNYLNFGGLLLCWRYYFIYFLHNFRYNLLLSHDWPLRYNLRIFTSF